jgi:4-hydroxy-tetrahydrodipicolinate reductase
MKYAIVGPGRMGSAIDAEAARRGHERVTLVARDSGEDAGRLAARAGAELAFEFTRAEAAERNVLDLLGAGVSVVCGTTGWLAGPAVEEACAGGRAGLIVAPNFSLGVQLFLRLVAQAGSLLGRAALHEPWVHEAHHRAKRDLPSGTARAIGELLVRHDPRLRGMHEGPLDGPLAPGLVHVSGSRGGHEPGTHCVVWDGEHETIALEHRARGRAGFALGAVLAAEWLAGRTGRHELDDVLDDVVGGARRAGSG